MKYSIKTYIKAYWKHLFTVQFWGMLWFKITPRKIRKYFIATVLIDFHENKRAVVNEDILEQSYKLVES